MKLSEIYAHVDDIDVYVGGLAETHVEGLGRCNFLIVNYFSCMKSLSEVYCIIIGKQFFRSKILLMPEAYRE